MIQKVKGDIWDYLRGSNRVVIPTNGVVRDNGSAVMGRGLAYQCVHRYRVMPRLLGAQIRKHGNHVFEFTVHSENYWAHLITFPVKNQWWKPAELSLIERSTWELKELIGTRNTFVYLPRVGCGSGGLKWEIVQPVLTDILEDERFILVTL